MNTPYRPNPYRVFFGFLIAPVAGALAYAGILAAIGTIVGSKGVIAGTATMFVIALIFAAGSTILLGVPTYLVIRRRDRLTLLNIVLASGILGWAPSLIMTSSTLWYLAAVHPWERSLPNIPVAMLQHWGLAIASGVAGGLAFWAYVIRPCPDHTHSVAS
ncbi:hypothetical protein [Microvirga arsenatis]|uniref:Uncharacterized protein n=1 Tax=Microvirga arsenatis TaxID=2692265 RepID=A0ABW9YTB4_9HYPH|nr:hypothetical protein [Microvirga arsenatis]NBJ12404.1 hypothetical protein [Microvirga arsenatis]NBJ23280.1 hypothetical protein [Microvirga arsenatis]